MNESTVLDLSDCSEFRQTLEARPPRVVHGTAVVLVSLLAVGLTWAALTRADLVVKAPGRVRPVTTPVKIFNPARGDVLSATPGGRVAEVHFREGDEVRKGQVLLRLDTSRIDHEIARRKRTLRSLEDALARTIRLVELTA